VNDRRYVRRLAGCLTALLVVAAMAIATMTAARAQSTSNEGSPAILAALAELQSSIGSVDAAVTALQGSLTALGTTVSGLGTSQESNVRSTPPMMLGDDPSIACAVANVDDEPHAIRAEVIRGFDGSVVGRFGGSYQIQPGEAQVGSFGPPGGRDVYYCRFTVVDGSRSDILATAERLTGGPRAVVAAE
jgi:hypothetical protein